MLTHAILNDIIRKRNSFCTVSQQRVADKKVMQWLIRTHPKAAAILERLVSETAFERRRYGSTTYTWAIHDLIEGDPYPAVTFPRAALMLAFVYCIDTLTEDEIRVI